MDEHLPRPLALRLGPRFWIAIDVVTAAGAAAFLFLVTTWTLSLPGVPPAGTAVVVVLATVPLACRRRWPVAVFGVMLVAGAVGYTLHVVPDWLQFITVALTLYLVGTQASGLRSAVALTVAVLTILGDTSAHVATQTVRPGGAVPLSMASVASSALAGIIVACGAWAIGIAVRQQRTYQAGLRDQATRRALIDERLRIARELHDVVAHSMSVIRVQASVAHHVATDPVQARSALADIAATSRDALHELRHLLGVLRADTDTDEAGALTPVPGVADLDGLIADTDRAGVHAELRTVGDPRALPPGVDLSTYRIIQEALTNVIKHAAPARVTVTLEYRPGDVAVDVTDDGPGPDPTRTPGHGLLGMRERVTLYGGTLHTGPLPGRGFRVQASIPTTDGNP